MPVDVCPADFRQPLLDDQTAQVIAHTERTYETVYLLKNKEFDIQNENKLLTDIFEQFVTQIQKQIKGSTNAAERTRHGHRLNSIKKGVDIIEKWPGRIASGYQAKQVKGIGDGIAKRIDEILRTGTLVELQETHEVSDYMRRVNELSQVTGIGPVTAKKLVDQYDLQGVEDLIRRWQAGEIREGKNQLTHHMVVGLRWYGDITQRIPRPEIQLVDEML